MNFEEYHMNAVAEVQDEVIPVPIVFTDSAAQKVAQLIEEAVSYTHLTLPTILLV